MSVDRVKMDMAAVDQMITELKKAAEELERVQAAVLDHAGHYEAGSFYGIAGCRLAAGMKDVLAVKIGKLVEWLGMQSDHVAKARADLLTADRSLQGTF